MESPLNLSVKTMVKTMVTSVPNHSFLSKFPSIMTVIDMDMSTILRMMNMKIIFQCHFLLLVFRRTRRAL